MDLYLELKVAQDVGRTRVLMVLSMLARLIFVAFDLPVVFAFLEIQSNPDQSNGRFRVHRNALPNFHLQFESNERR